MFYLRTGVKRCSSSLLHERGVQESGSAVFAVRLKHGKSAYKKHKDFRIPEKFIKYKAIRSSGPGGQNVNKVSTCVEARFDIGGATFLNEDAKKRLLTQQSNRVNKKGELVIQAQEERTQDRNKVIAKERIDQIVAHAMVEPKERDMWQGVGEVTKLRRKDMKQHRKQVKSNRKMSKSDYF
mmetsp:Transcript_3486/g.4674  ORF Transcript_3486/g.4674 Transcript_3486/m.4674 type:complete len:181 (+) Transcript_3486:98-640(+)